MQNIDPQLIGQTLLESGFKQFTLYLFKAIEGKKFIVEKLHEQIFQYFQDIYDGKRTRVNLSLCPRSGKTTLSEYFLVYTLTQNPKANIIYTSYSASLLNEISAKIVSILEHPIYKIMFPQKTIEKEEKTLNPISEFWKDYLFKEQGKNTYSARLIRTYAGGVCLFNSIGSSITGFGAGVRGQDKFSGFLLIDDANKPSEIRSQVIREKVVRYFEETLLSRLNNPTTPILNVQQRLSLHDLTATLESKYNFDTLKVPLLDEQGNCNLPSQYTPERIKELKINNFMFQSQFQQNPIVEDGEIIKREWFKYYDVNFKYHYKKIVIASDTAMSTKESADRSCLMVGGITQNNTLHIIDFIVGRWDYPTLKQKAIDLWNKWQLDKRSTSASALYVEEKASGIQILQELKKTGIPILPLKADKDKYTRVQGVLEYIASGLVHLPHNEQYGFNPEILNEVESFTGNNTHLHDDICLVGNTKIATLFGDKQIKDIKKGDYVITPYGVNKVLKAECTGIHEVINKKGITGTKKHKIFANGKFEELGSIKYDVDIDTLTYEGLLKWKYKNLLYSMGSNIDLWGRKGIISLNRLQIKGEKVLKDFMLQFGNFIAEKQYQKAMLFTIKMATILIMTSLIWNVYQGTNILKNILSICRNAGEHLKKLNNYLKLENCQKNGTQAKKVKNGIAKMQKKLWQKKDTNKNVQSADKNTKLADKEQYAENVKIDSIKENYEKKEKVYNITVEKAQTYYANGVLVSNCDTLVYLIMVTIARKQVSILEVI